jgi:hypothetical protein
VGKMRRLRVSSGQISSRRIVEQGADRHTRWRARLQRVSPVLGCFIRQSRRPRTAWAVPPAAAVPAIAAATGEGILVEAFDAKGRRGCRASVGRVIGRAGGRRNAAGREGAAGHEGEEVGCDEPRRDAFEV